MRKLFVKLLLVLLPFTLWYVFIIPFKTYYMDEEYPCWKYQKDITTGSDEKYDVVILGDSAGQTAIRPSLMEDYNAVNLSLGGGSIIEMYYTLDTFLKNNPAPDTVILLISEKNYMIHPQFINRTVYFHYLDLYQLAEFERICAEEKDDYWDDSTDIINIAAYYLFSPEKYLPAVYSSNFGSYRERNEILYNDSASNRGWRLYGSSDGYYGTNYYEGLDSFNTNKVLDRYMNMTLSLCEEHGIRVILEHNPVNEYEDSMISESFRMSWNDYFTLLSKSHPGAIVSKTIEVYDGSLFGDDIHLNERGASVFTAKIVDEIK